MVALANCVDKLEIGSAQAHPWIRVGCDFVRCNLFTLAGAALRQRSKVKSIAARVDLVIPSSEPLYAVDPDYQPFLFYIKPRVVYASRIDDLPLDARYVLVRPEKENDLIKSERWAPHHARRILDLTDYRKQTVILAEIGDADPLRPRGAGRWRWV